MAPKKKTSQQSLFAYMAPKKKTSANILCERRKYMVQHGSKPVETPGSPGYQLARSIRKARSQGIFNAAELAELDSPLLAAAAAKASTAGMAADQHTSSAAG